MCTTVCTIINESLGGNMLYNNVYLCMSICMDRCTTMNVQVGFKLFHGHANDNLNVCRNLECL